MPTSPSRADIVVRLRASGSVFAEEEAAILVEAAADDAQLDSFVERRIAGEPLEPLVGWVRFGRLRLALGPGVFVPRQRSLRLARLAVRRTRSSVDGGRAPVFVDAYCGVAPIAASVAASVPRAVVHAIDVDPRALAFARRNLPDVAGVHAGDGLDGLPRTQHGAVDVIAAVPPYVPETDLALLPREARDFEPEAALVGGGADGLDRTRRLIADARGWMSPGGRLLIELHARQLPEAARAGGQSGWTARVHRANASRTGIIELVAT